MKIKGFKSAAVKAGIKYENRLDLGLIYSEAPAVTAGIFTTNQVKAAPVMLDMERLLQGRAQAILVNSGNANACTGKQGMEAALSISKMLAEPLGIDEAMIQLASTGVIGEALNLKAFETSIPELVQDLSEDNFGQVAQAMMTTDTVAKLVHKTAAIGGKEINFVGMAKGSGMIMPNMATMLAFVLTDAQIGFPALHKSLVNANECTFNRITVDGDTSTNDMVLIMASGEAENSWIDDETIEEQEEFQHHLEIVLKELAMMIVADGEGASKAVTIRVCGAKEDRDALRIAREVANSKLVKTAFFGEDANWGRIMAVVGRAGVKIYPERIDIAFGDVLLVKNGVFAGKEAELAASRILKQPKFSVIIDLKDGVGCEEIYTCDLSVDYVKINADYRS
ncbi:MAG: bifunctional ornithine acetyltransferase/N-acetylglutamate synthase [Deltaproteobacteria bacterium]|nr:MAG: bifunctional ornithine acetyltransferase/N-acetylglutamate synthase [Deltaproteobacteria bacterium]